MAASSYSAGIRARADAVSTAVPRTEDECRRGNRKPPTNGTKILRELMNDGDRLQDVHFAPNVKMCRAR